MKYLLLFMPLLMACTNFSNTPTKENIQLAECLCKAQGDSLVYVYRDFNMILFTCKIKPNQQSAIIGMYVAGCSK